MVATLVLPSSSAVVCEATPELLYCIDTWNIKKVEMFSHRWSLQRSEELGWPNKKKLLVTDCGHLRWRNKQRRGHKSRTLFTFLDITAKCEFLTLDCQKSGISQPSLRLRRMPQRAKINSIGCKSQWGPWFPDLMIPSPGDEPALRDVPRNTFNTQGFPTFS